MKKFVACIIAVCLGVSIAACGNGGESGESDALSIIERATGADSGQAEAIRSVFDELNITAVKVEAYVFEDEAEAALVAGLPQFAFYAVTDPEGRLYGMILYTEDKSVMAVTSDEMKDVIYGSMEPFFEAVG